MTSKFYLRASTPASSLTAPSGSAYNVLVERAGASNVNIVTTTTAGGTAIDVATAGGIEQYWFTEPLTTGITVSGTMTVQVRGLESVATVNACLAVIVERTDNSGTPISTVLDATVPDPATELTTTATTYSDTYTPTSTTFDAGDRIKVTAQVRNVGTMGAGTVTFSINAAADGTAPWVEFAEDIVTDQPVEVGSYEIYGSNGYRR